MAKTFYQTLSTSTYYFLSPPCNTKLLLHLLILAHISTSHFQERRNWPSINRQYLVRYLILIVHPSDEELLQIFQLKQSLGLLLGFGLLNDQANSRVLRRNETNVISAILRYGYIQNLHKNLLLMSLPWSLLVIRFSFNPGLTKIIFTLLRNDTSLCY